MSQAAPGLLPGHRLHSGPIILGSSSLHMQQLMNNNLVTGSHTRAKLHKYNSNDHTKTATSCPKFRLKVKLEVLPKLLPGMEIPLQKEKCRVA